MSCTHMVVAPDVWFPTPRSSCSHAPLNVSICASWVHFLSSNSILLTLLGMWQICISGLYSSYSLNILHAYTPVPARLISICVPAPPSSIIFYFHPPILEPYSVISVLVTLYVNFIPQIWPSASTIQAGQSSWFSSFFALRGDILHSDKRSPTSGSGLVVVGDIIDVLGAMLLTSRRFTCGFCWLSIYPWCFHVHGSFFVLYSSCTG